VRQSLAEIADARDVFSFATDRYENTYTIRLEQRIGACISYLSQYAKMPLVGSLVQIACLVFLATVNAFAFERKCVQVERFGCKILSVI
jgi:hypothetical protein